MSTEPSSPSTTRVRTRTRPPAARLLLLALASCLALTARPRAAIVEEIVAKVNNRIISKSEFEERSSYILKQIYQQYSGAELDQRLKDARETMLANMITELLLVERSQTLLDLDKVRKNLVDDFRKQQNISSDEDLERLLKEQGMTRKDLEEQLLRLAVPQEIINYEVRRKISVSDAEVGQYYELHQKDWETAPTVTFNEIVLFYEDANRPEVVSRAQGVVREARGGTEFGELVQKYSEAPSKETGGFLGPLPAADLLPAIAEPAFKLQVGDVSDPIDTGRSLHILRLVGKTERVVKTQDEVKEAIAKAVRDQKFRPLYEHYIRKLWKESQIEILPKYEQFLVWSPVMSAKTGNAKLPPGAPGAEPETQIPVPGGSEAGPQAPSAPAADNPPAPAPSPAPQEGGASPADRANLQEIF
jgi:peptidyl-prolyl cis-trans isomerase SurA